MKKVLFLLFILLPFMASAQKVKQICDVKLGMSFDKTREKLSKTLGKSTDYSPNKYIQYQNQAYEGIHYDKITFFFGHKNSFLQTGPIGLNEVQFLIMCEDMDEAIEKCRQIASVMRKQYEVEELQTQDGFPGFYGGENPQNDALRGFSVRPITYNDVIFVAFHVWPAPFK